MTRHFGSFIGIVCALTLMGCASSEDSEEKTASSADIQTSRYALALPDSAPEGVENTSDNTDEGSVALSYETDYGKVSLEVFSSSLEYDSVRYNGEVTQGPLEISGESVETVIQDLRKVVLSSSADPQIVAQVRVEQIPHEEGDEFTVFSASLFAPSRSEDSQINDFVADMKAMAQSLEIDP